MSLKLYRLNVLNHVFPTDLECNSDSDCQYHSCSSVETPVCSFGICYCKGLLFNNDEVHVFFEKGNTKRPPPQKKKIREIHETYFL